MKVKVEINPLYSEVHAILKSNSMTQEIEDIKNILESYNHVLMGYSDDNMTLLQYNEIYRIYTENQKVFAVTNKGKYLLKERLYEIEIMLSRHQFIKVSRFEIINVMQIQELENLYSGNIKIIFKYGESTFVSRRFVSQIKKKLGI
ncbi:LytTR family DNA-binding domain-containing protein [Clostridium perfringens]|uniref:LytTR family DNA-binding domain-containing protein n=1 Tax=Clostridium perfringens TaxID=1502 RepID=UPI00232F76A0|nr:LytTR family DNA-binding domain-containing protein [Clostridium perfringens]MDB2050420.1 LytTR family DNA-binding domain-containing protein [Clostridium perfringens]